LNPFKQVEAETIANSSGLKTEVCTDTGGGINVTSISNGDYIKVREVDFVDGVTSFDARVSSSGSSAKIELHLDSETGTLLGSCDVSGASSWTTKTCTVSGGSGKHDLFLKFVGGSGDLFKFNWWKFTGPTMPPDGTGGSSSVGGSGGTGRGGSTGAGGAVGAGGTGKGTAVNGGTSSIQGNGGSANGSGGKNSNSSGGKTADPGTLSVGGGGTLTNKGGATYFSPGPNSNGGSVSVTDVVSGGNGTAPATSVPGTVEGNGNSEGDSCSCRVQGHHGQKGTWAVFSMMAVALMSWRRRGSTFSRDSNKKN
jgi:hypothetical protein